MKPTRLLTAVMALMIAACFNGSLDFKIRFDDVHGLKTGDPVYFEASAIGNVEKIAYTDAGLFLVEVSIRKEFAPAATDDSRFFIDTDPQKREQRVIRVVQLEPGGEPIAEGALVEGHTKYAVIAEGWARQLGRNMTIVESGIDAFLNELQGITTEEQVAELEQRLDEIIAGLGDMSREMKRTLENDILPLLREKIEELRRILEQSGREEDMERLDEKMETIDEGLQV